MNLQCTLHLGYSDRHNKEQKSKKRKDRICTLEGGEDTLYSKHHNCIDKITAKKQKHRFRTSVSLVTYEGALHLETTRREGGLIHFCFDEETQKWKRSAPYATSLGIINQVGSFTLPDATGASQLHLLFLSQSGNLIHFRARGFQQPSNGDSVSFHDDPFDYSSHLPGSTECRSGPSDSLEPQFATDSLGIILTQVRVNVLFVNKEKTN